MAEKTLIADDSASPEHFSVMFPATCCSRVPQRLFRSDGLDWALQNIRSNFPQHTADPQHTQEQQLNKQEE